MKKKVVFIICGVISFCCVVACIVTGFVMNRANQNVVVMKVNGTSVTLDEFQLFVNENRSAVTTYFKLKYNADQQQDYWTKSFGGEKPIDRIKKLAAKSCIESKVIQKMAVDEGLIKNISFSGIKNACEIYNKRAESALSSNKTIYGMTNFEISQFYDYYISNLENKLKQKYEKNILKITDAEIISYYKKNIDKFTSKQKYIVDELYIKYGSNKQKAYKTAMLAKQKLSEEKSFKNVCAKFAKNGKYERRGIIPDSTGNSLSSEAVIDEKIDQMRVGSVSDIIDVGDGYAVIKLVSSVKNVKINISKVKTQIEQQILNDKFDSLIKKRVSVAAVTYNKQGYDSIVVS